MELFSHVFKCYKAVKSLSIDFVRWAGTVKDLAAWFQIVGDTIRVKAGFGPTIKNSQSTIRLRTNRSITYRLNKGDIWSIREVFLDECYRFPGAIDPKVIIDLGANIGMTSLWLDIRFFVRHIVTVEPDHSNYLIAKKNLMGARAKVTLIEAAVGSADGFAQFNSSTESNKGFLEYEKKGRTRVICMATLLHEAGIDDEVDLLKVDIEGGEADLFSCNLDWLRRVRHIIAEFHPQIIDRDMVVQSICAAGFRHVPPDSVFTGNMEAFVREDLS